MSLVVDFRELDAALTRARKAGADFRPVWKTLVPFYRKDQGRHIQKQLGDGEKPFTPIAPATRARRKFKRKGRRIRGKRALSRRMTAALRRTVAPNLMRLTARVKWARVQAEGGVVGHNAVIPPRPFLYVSRPFQARLELLMLAHLRNSWER